MRTLKTYAQKYAAQTYFKIGRTLNNILVEPKDKDTIKQNSGVIYWHRCNMLEWNKENIEVSARIFEEMFKEHIKASSAIYAHQSRTDHSTTME